MKMLDNESQARIKYGPKPLLYEAAHGGNVQIMQMLLDRAAKDGRDSKVLIETPDSLSMTTLHWAAYGGKVEMVEFLLSKGANIDARTDKQSGNTFVYFCIDFSEKRLN